MTVSITEALDIIYKNIQPLSTEILPIEMVLGRICAEDVTAVLDMPRFDNSAMDGYAVKCADAGKTVRCTEVIFAGDSPQTPLKQGEAIKIMTGAPLPEGCEAIVPVEQAEAKGDDVMLPPEILPGSFHREAGSDMGSGAVYLSLGEEINAYRIALLASQGVTHLQVFRKIKVVVFGTGDELRPHYEKIEAHQLYNSNTPMFLERAKELGCEVRYVPRSIDTIASLEEAIRSSIDADIIITSGGVSMGDKDFTKEAFRNLGMELFFDKVQIKPGKPTAFGKIGDTAIINLPGNPLASMVNFEVFIRAVIYRMSGAKAYRQNTIETTLREDFRIKAGNYTVKLGSFDGKTFMPFKQQLPGMLSPMQHADGYIITPPDVTFLAKGTKVRMIPIHWDCRSEKEEVFFTGG
ncbi:gephyrin-like molybdotransferase Glp [Sulfurovum riftiae]|uniref:Molybdopterin molybdenumtransferase n=1 Tax=Sulfurovum riftiae TaxID=1630136 RepID=A0A151CH33_9BACT|nr:gephyrin-like molybdotransferase Glp [Sulfurovum riftiae]KYJ86807.1 molybdopterin biosynthesis protein MoeA [Sulfurovum riftiae]